MLRLQFNPLAVVDHNQWRLPRVLFHLAHVAVGLPVFALGIALAMPVAWMAVAALLLACLDKCVWIDWRRSTGQTLHWVGLHVGDWPDFFSDLGLTLLGAFAGVLFGGPVAIIGWIASLYVLSTFNGT